MSHSQGLLHEKVQAQETAVESRTRCLPEREAAVVRGYERDTAVV